MIIKDQMFHPKKVLFADLDGTLIETTTGNTFPQGIWDMKFKFNVLDCIKAYGFEILIIISNQGGFENGFVDEKHFLKKIEYIRVSLMEFLGIPVDYRYCKINDKNSKYRKPNTGMLENVSFRHSLKNVSKEDMLMIGDASGEPLGWSDTDLQTAVNFGIDYMDVNDFVKRIDV